ncbi:hypothetical protein PLICRDRAFT_177283 [Plicaturopsis crispa FD-325 SS-3]|nr:hypothetical protein PLICRDRAFT_177283 [Plicaturopsis crispa FD-325 SS-3]
MTKRAGCGLDPTGILRTSQGELAVPCRACPLPGVNLPENWADAPKAMAYIYRLILAQDACFRFMNRMRSTEKADPSLGPGWAYFQETSAYSTFLKNYTHDKEISTCVAFTALMLANMKRTKGVASTGVGGVSCGRHETFRANGLGDLQKGEWYANMDYIFFSSIVGCALLYLLVSYNVACQWSKNFWSRMEKTPARLRLAMEPANVTFVVPAFHIEAHESKCRNRYNSRRTKGTGRSDLEGPERLWAWLKGAAASTREMGPGHRRDTLDDFCGYANWLKIIGFGNLFLRRMLEAIPEARAHRQVFEDFKEGLRAEQPGAVEAWEAMLALWEGDPTQPNPYVAGDSDEPTMADVRLAMAQEEQQRVEVGALNMHDSTPAAFLLLALEIELVQNTIAAEVRAAGREPTPLQMAGIQDRRNAILKKIRRMRELQAIYMPRLYDYLHPEGDQYNERNGVLVENVRLHLPSSFNAVARTQVCLEGLLAMEERLRLAETSDALDELCRNIQTRSFVHKFRISNRTGQKRATRTQTLINGVQVRLTATKVRYRRARAAYLALHRPGEWENKFHILRDKDVVGANGQAVESMEEEGTIDARMDPLRPDGGRRRLSWIWFCASSTGDANVDEELHDALRVEWAKAKARAERWHEEVVLLNEEMCCVIAFCRWKADWWAVQGKHREHTTTPELYEGIQAYASEHASMERRMVSTLEAKWKSVHKCAVAVIEGGDVREFSPNDGTVEVEIPLDEGLEDE